MAFRVTKQHSALTPWSSLRVTVRCHVLSCSAPHILPPWGVLSDHRRTTSSRDYRWRLRVIPSSTITFTTTTREIHAGSSRPIHRQAAKLYPLVAGVGVRCVAMQRAVSE
ncbi:hypothetical protein E2C01_024651 [Portunus trituberculatus]|uniref:Uncharacterized protein n=1 Tax=Portunus trituberculatus TaxID=210409 RepID=A0A5B7EFD7_PORTR|nr:hypothetical protein [Portunus trituberculatus]